MDTFASLEAHENCVFESFLGFRIEIFMMLLDRSKFFKDFR